MNTCQYAGDPFEEPRSHPWTGSTEDAAARYYDFVSEPKLIRTALEDFHPFGEFKAIESFYGLLESLNSPSSSLESNDCAFTPAQADDSPHSPGSLRAEGRVMLLFRELPINLLSPQVDELRMSIHIGLEEVDKHFEHGLVGTTLVPVRFIDLPDSGEPKLGQQLMISFWAWGDSQVKVMHNLDRLLGNLHQALEAISGSTAN